MILMPDGDPARRGRSRSRPDEAKSCSSSAANIFLYAVDKQNLRYQGETHLVKDNGEATAGERRSRSPASQYAGNWDPEPGGWRRLATVLKNDAQGRRSTVEPVKLGDGKLTARRTSSRT